MSRAARRRESKGLESPTGLLEVLNVGLGDLKVTFNKHDAAETAKARRMIEKLMRDGYAILVAGTDGTYSRVQGFDPATDSYIVAEETTSAGETPAAPTGKRRGRPPTKKVSAHGSKAVAVARTAGG